MIKEVRLKQDGYTVEITMPSNKFIFEEKNSRGHAIVHWEFDKDVLLKALSLASEHLPCPYVMSNGELVTRETAERRAKLTHTELIEEEEIGFSQGTL